MSNADANYARLSFKPETAFDETPAAGLALKNFPYTKEGLEYDKTTEVSAEVRSDRNVEDIVPVGGDSKGTVDFELSDYAEWFDTFLAAALMTDGITNTSAAALNDDGIVVSTVSPVESQFGPPQSPPIRVGRAVVFNDLLVSGSILPSIIMSRDDSDLPYSIMKVRPSLGGEGPILSGATYGLKEIKNGKTRRSFFIEKNFTDMAKSVGYAGMMIDEFSLDITSRKLITGSMSFIGAKAYQNGGFTVATRTDTSGNVLSASNNVGAIKCGSGTADVKSLKLKIKNNLRGQDAVASASNTGIGVGRCEVTGTLEVYFSSMALYDSIVAHETVSLIVGLTLGKYCLAFYLPAIKLLKGNPNVSGVNSDLMLPIEFQAKRDPFENASIIVSTGVPIE